MDSLNFLELVSKAIKENAVQVFTALVGAGVLAAFALWRKGKCHKNHHRSRVRILKRSTSLAIIHGGEIALQKLVEYHEARVNAHKLEIAECELKLWFENTEKPDFRELAKITTKLEICGKEDIVIATLEEEIQKALQKNRIHEAYELEMLLVEMLIYKGEFKKAWTHKCLEDQAISDARRPLYKAIILLLTSQRKKAEEFWRKFCELRTYFSCQPAVKESMEETGIYKICSGFDEFERIVNRLKEDILKAKEIKISSEKTSSKK